jgi:hypothetical protein
MDRPWDAARAASGGGVRNEYTAPPGAGPLPQNLPIGAFLVKRKWGLGYTLNGERVDDFPIIGSLILMSIGLACSGDDQVAPRCPDIDPARRWRPSLNGSGVKYPQPWQRSHKDRRVVVITQGDETTNLRRGLVIHTRAANSEQSPHSQAPKNKDDHQTAWSIQARTS